MEENKTVYDEIIESLAGLKIVGKVVVTVGEYNYEVDCGYKPPKVKLLGKEKD